ncbi:hypothetical protein C8R43DRAFT_947205 [Mycena crocata]|nr:hypothetical protein C8R43DRAFT_947205 [Mycena crocata]
MPFDLVRRIRLDAQEGGHIFLLNAVHNKDFVATRDRSISRGSLNTFKRMDFEWEATPWAKGALRSYFPLVFGRVDLIAQTRCVKNWGHMIRLAHPVDMGCSSTEAYNTQLKVMRDALHEDAKSLAGPVPGSWMSWKGASGDFPLVDGCFYVHFTGHKLEAGKFIPAVDDNIELVVGLTRFDTLNEKTGAEIHPMSTSSRNSASPDRASPPVRVPMRKRQRECVSSSDSDSPPQKITRRTNVETTESYLDIEASESDASGGQSASDNSMDDFIVDDDEDIEQGEKVMQKATVVTQSYKPSRYSVCVQDGPLKGSFSFAFESLRPIQQQIEASLFFLLVFFPFLMRLILPHPEPVDPTMVVDCILNKYDALIHRSACGREQSLNGLGEFRATILGSVAEDLRIVSDPSVHNISHLLTLNCPDWSSFGWNPSTFYHIYAEQHAVLRELTERQAVAWPGRQSHARWTDGDRLIVCLTLNTDISIPVSLYSSQLPDMRSLSPGCTLLIDGTFHCSWSHRAQEPRVFSIEAIHIQKVIEKVAMRIDTDAVIAEVRVKEEEEKETEIKREDDATETIHFLTYTMISPYLQYIIDGGARSLAFAEYKTDFVPWEEANVGPTDNSVSGDTFDHPKVMIKANSREMFVARAFGEIAEIVGEMENEHGFYVRLCCPTNASCATEDVYLMQADKLQNIINEDELTSGDIPGPSWFTAQAEIDTFERGGFYEEEAVLSTLRVGQRIRFLASIHRTDPGWSKYYCLLSRFIVEATPEDIPTKGEDHRMLVPEELILNTAAMDISGDR